MPPSHHRSFCFPVTAPGLVLLLLLALLPACRDKPQETASPPRPLRLGLAIQASSSLAILADELGLWRQAGLTVTVTKYISGQQALNQGLFPGKVDAATTGDIPIAVAACERDDFAVVAKIGQIDNAIRIIARRDRGIRQPSDLRGKRLGCKKGTVTHYFLDLFLMRQSIRTGEVRLVSQEPDTTPQALLATTLDAAAMREPYLGQALGLLGDQAVVLDNPLLYTMTDLLVVNRRFLAENPGTVSKLLQGLLLAETYLAEHPVEAQRILAGYFDPGLVNVLDDPGRQRLTVSLDHTVVLALEEETEWVVRNGLGKSRQPANLLRFIDQGPLAAARAARQ